MSVPPAQQIDSILKTLEEAEQGSGLSHDDPALIALEQIMLAKVEALEAARVGDTPVPEAGLALDPEAGLALDPTEDHHTSPLPSILFAAEEEDPSR